LQKRLFLNGCNGMEPLKTIGFLCFGGCSYLLGLFMAPRTSFNH
jgi:hypothetical protein